jgi:hypothetical protein
MGADGVTLLYEGSSWAAQTSPAPGVRIMDIWGTEPKNFWAVGENGTVLHFTGNWTLVPIGTTATLNAVWGTAANDVFVAGEGGLIFHYDGTSWSPVRSPTDQTLEGIFATAGDTVYFCGRENTVLTLLYRQPL